MHHLLKNVLSFLLLNFFIFFYQLQQITTFAVLHHNQKVLLAFKHFVKSYNFTVPNFTQNVNFLHDFLPTVGVLHVLLVNGFDSHIPACQLVDTKSHFTKGAFSNKLHEFVKLQ